MEQPETGRAAMNVTLHIDGKPVTLEDVTRKAQEIAFTFAGKSYAFRSHRLPAGRFLLEREVAGGVWQRMSASVWQGRDARRVQLGAFEANVTELAADAAHSSPQAA